jgi:hypothetical protein
VSRQNLNRREILELWIFEKKNFKNYFQNHDAENWFCFGRNSYINQVWIFSAHFLCEYKLSASVKPGKKMKNHDITSPIFLFRDYLLFGPTQCYYLRSSTYALRMFQFRTISITNLRHLKNQVAFIFLWNNSIFDQISQRRFLVMVCFWGSQMQRWDRSELVHTIIWTII